MESTLEAVKLLPVANGEIWSEGSIVGQSEGGGCQQGTNVESRKDYGSMEVQQSQPTAGTIHDGGGGGEMQAQPPVMVRLIQNCMCIPDAAAAKSGNYDKCSFVLSGLVYSSLAVKGGFVFLVTIHSSEWLQDETDLFQVKLGTLLSSAFFVFLWLFWVLVYRWSRPMPTKRPSGSPASPQHRDSVSLTLVWLILILYFVGSLIILLNVVIRKLDVVFGSNHKERTSEEDVEVKLIRTNFILMVICFLVYAALMLALKLEQVTTKRWRPRSRKEEQLA